MVVAPCRFVPASVPEVRRGWGSIRPLYLQKRQMQPPVRQLHRRPLVVGQTTEDRVRVRRRPGPQPLPRQDEAPLSLLHGQFLPCKRPCWGPGNPHSGGRPSGSEEPRFHQPEHHLDIPRRPRRIPVESVVDPRRQMPQYTPRRPIPERRQSPGPRRRRNFPHCG